MDISFKKLPTWGNRAEFFYEGSIANGVLIQFGQEKTMAELSGQQLELLLNNFRGRTVPIGTSHDAPTKGSVGAWMVEHLGKSGLATYLGAILISERYARKSGSEIVFF